MSKDNGQEKGLIEAVSHQLCPSIDPKQFLATVKTMCCKIKGDVSNEELAAFLMTCQKYNLNPIMKEIYPFRDKHGNFQCVVGIDGWINLANQHPQFGGIETEESIDDKGKPICVVGIVHRKDHDKPTRVPEWFAECERDTVPWKTRPIRMLRHKATIQAIRYAFGYSGIMTPDEAEEIIPEVEYQKQQDRMTIGPMKLEVEAHKAGVSVQELEECSQDLFSKSYQNLTPDEATAVLEDAIGYSQNDLDPEMDEGDTGDITHAPPDKAKSSPVSAGDQEDFLP